MHGIVNAGGVSSALNGSMQTRPEGNPGAEISKQAPTKFDSAQAEKALSTANVKRTIELANDALKNTNNSLRFQMDETLNQPIVRVVNEENGEVIRQLPSEETVRVARNIESLRGILFDSAI
ncbi:MAG: hypothetical protein CBC12_00835 [Candidatus Puniceispirillum sp. TMED52]|nr:MAG: hypothetical protein CBC12_00835 [Candidatus Puniceispirillum sp. TMED52]|tara:strand:- start:315 stop:680 length:366 start_codon:yes stop_codon:yes gene_type:complete